MYNSQGGVGYIGKNLISQIPIKIPELERQRKIGELRFRKENAVKTITEIKIEIENTIRNIKVQNENKKRKEKLKKIFKISGGNDGLTREFIYKNQPSNSEDALKVYSGATTQEGELGYLSKKAPIKIENGPAIVVVRKGKAGWMEFMEDEHFAINDDAYVMKPKDGWDVNLTWFINQYQELFFNIVTSKSDNGTFSKSYAEEQSIELPEIKVQNEIAYKLKKYNELVEKLKILNIQIEKLLEKQIL